VVIGRSPGCWTLEHKSLSKGRNIVMSLKRLFFVLALVAALVFVSRPAAADAGPSSATVGPCKISYSTDPIGESKELNWEGRTERSTDVIITGSTSAVNCFKTSNIITVVWNAVQTVPPLAGPPAPPLDVTFLTNPTVVDVTASDFLSVTVSESLAKGPGGKMFTFLEIDVEVGTGDSKASVEIENLRFDVTTLGEDDSTSGPGLEATLAVPVCGCTDPLVPGSIQVGEILRTIKEQREVDQIGLGFENGVIPVRLPPDDPSPFGQGNVAGILTVQAEIEFESNPNWSDRNPFRVALSGGSKADPDDISTGPMDLVWDVEHIPGGVTVTLPKTMSFGATPNCGTVFTAAGTLTKTGPGDLVVIYHTTKALGLGPGEMSVSTAAIAQDTNCSLPYAAEFNFPWIGVTIADPSGTGLAFLKVVLGPGELADFPNDLDVNASAIPRYLQNTGISEPSRGIIKNERTGDPTPFFKIAPTRTQLLYPFVTNKLGWQTGIEIGNTGNDSTIFGDVGQAGALDVFFFPGQGGGGPFNYTVGPGVGRGLDGAGLLQPGGDWAITLDALLVASGHANMTAGGGGSFEGYIIVVCHFNWAHGAAMIFNSTATMSSVPALVLGGDSARQGNVTLLPERLVM